MLTTNELRSIAARSGGREIRNVEIDIILIFLLQLFHERGLFEHLAFKGGTMLRKMVFGPRGRLSTDLDFTLCSRIARDAVYTSKASRRTNERQPDFRRAGFTRFFMAGIKTLLVDPVRTVHFSVPLLQRTLLSEIVSTMS